MTDPLVPSSLLGPLFASGAMRAIVNDRARLQRMLDVEAALARAEAAVGVIPQSAVGPIEQACDAARFDLSLLGEAAVSSGVVTIPMVKMLTAEVAKNDKAASGYIHWGATSQDIVDTALMLELRAAIDALGLDLDRAIAGFVKLAEKHRNTAAVGRTWLQHALPIPFGLKLAGYAGAVSRSRARLARLRTEALVLQFGGAAGTLAALGDQGLAVAEKLAAELKLPLPPAPWHSHHDRVAEIAAALAILAGTCGKIARDVSLMMQTDTGEAFEPAAAGRGGSSTMPHKRNPVAASVALAAAVMAPNLAATVLAGLVQEHERALGGWQAEWPTMPTLLLVVSGALAATVDIAEGLEVDEQRMRANLDATGGLIMAEAVMIALGRRIGRLEAHHIVEAASKRAAAERRGLEALLHEDPRVTAQLTQAEIARLFDPLAYQGVAQQFVDRLLADALEKNAT
jgi:3-carboxy-cis,cis-muconate cycloisomerase